MRRLLYISAKELIGEIPEINNQDFTIEEKSPNNTVVGIVVASSIDSLSYAILSGNIDNVFKINSLTGEISINDSTSLDIDLNPTFSLVIEVTDILFPQLFNSATITVTLTPQIILGLEITFDNIVNMPIGVVANDVSSWNTFFDLPTYGTEFDSVEIVENTVKLYGGNNITIKEDLFYFVETLIYNPDDDSYLNIDNNHIITVKDYAGCIIVLSKHCFADSTTMTEVYLPKCTTTLNDTLFNGGTSTGAFATQIGPPLAKIYMPLCENIAFATFNGLINLTDLTLPWNAITNIAKYTFRGCTSILSFSFPNVETIGEASFSDCLSPSFSFPKLTTIGQSAFGNCYSTTSFDFPLVTTIDNYAFSGCTSATYINVPLITIINTAVFYGTQCPSFDFPLVTEVHDFAFYGCTSASSFNLPNVTIVYGDDANYPNGAFNGCTGLIDITLPSLLSLGKSAFRLCSNLETVNLPEVLSIGTEAFRDCISLTSLQIPKCTDLGGSVANNFVFHNVIGSNISLTIPIALMTCNLGAPDGDIAYLTSNNTTTILYPIEIPAYYIASNGDDITGDGTIIAPYATLAKVNTLPLVAGDSVLFKRGDTFRGFLTTTANGSDISPITYGAYGSGDKPLILGSKDVSLTSDWTNVGTNLWATAAISYGEMGNLYFNNETSYGFRRLLLSSCTLQGDFFLNLTDKKIYMYSVSNPASFYTHIEAGGVYSNHIINISNHNYIDINNLDLRYAAQHGISFYLANYCLVEDCDISWIGGSYGGMTDGTRLGNGVQMWNNCSNIIVRNNNINQCYDAGITPQGSDTYTQSDLWYHHNLITNCWYNIEVFEYTGSTMTNVNFDNNTCVDAGICWAALQRPSKSNERHVMWWGGEGTVTNCNIRNNIFSGITDNNQAFRFDYTCHALFSNNLYNITNIARLGYPTPVTYSTLLSWQTITGQDANSVSANPLFLSLSDFHLQNTSPARNAGIDIGLSYNESAPDIGCYEYLTI